MPNKLDKNLYKAHEEQLKNIWGADFAAYRGDNGVWTLMRRRRSKQELSDELKAYAGNMQVQSSLPETELILRKQILEMERPKVDTVALSPGTRAKEHVEDDRLFFARLIAEIDERYDGSGTNSAAQEANGLQPWRLDWKMPPEPPDDWAEDRDEWFRQHKEPIIGLRPVPVAAIQFMPLKNPTYVIEKLKVPYLEWRKMEREGKYLTLDEAGKAVFTGEAMAEDESSSYSGKTMEVCTHAYQVPGTEDWKIVEYVFLEGQKVEDGEVWSERDSPFGCPYLFVRSGSEIPIETDPHLRFRPNLYPIYVTTATQNYWLTVLDAVASRAVSQRNIYIPLYGSAPELVQAWLTNELGATVEGAGAWIPVKETKIGDYVVAPRFEAIPSEIPEAVLKRIEQLEVQQQQNRTSRFATGNVSEQEIVSGTASAIISQTQQSKLPSDADLDHQADDFWKPLCRKVQAAIVFWEKDQPGPAKKYFVVATGEDPMVKGRKDPGTEVWVDAEKMGESMEIFVVIGNLTEQERQVRDANAEHAWQMGRIDFEQFLEGTGSEDPQRQIRVLNRERHLVESRAQFKTMEEEERSILWSAMTGINLAAMGQQQAVGQGESTSPPGEGMSVPPAAPINGNRPPLPNPGMSPPNISSPEGETAGMGAPY